MKINKYIVILILQILNLNEALLYSQTSSRVTKIHSKDIIYNNDYCTFNHAFLIGENIWFSSFQGKIGIVSQEGIVKIIYDTGLEINGWSKSGDSLVSFTVFNEDFLETYVFDAKKTEILKVLKLKLENSDNDYYSIQILSKSELLVCKRDELIHYDFSKLTKIQKVHNTEFSIYWDFFEINGVTYLFGNKKCYVFNYNDELLEESDIRYCRDSHNIISNYTSLYKYNKTNFNKIIPDTICRIFPQTSLNFNDNIVGVSIDSSNSLLFMSNYSYYSIRGNNMKLVKMKYTNHSKRKLGLVKNTDKIVSDEINWSTLISVQRLNNYYYFFDSNGILFRKKL